MAYSGYLIKVIKTDTVNTDFIIPMELMEYSSYKMTYSVLDTNATRNAKGSLIRTALPHRVPHCTIELRQMNNTQLAVIMGGIQSRYVNKKEKKVKLSVFLPEINDYVEEMFYLPDIEFTINHIEHGKVIYNPIDLEFIGY